MTEEDTARREALAASRALTPARRVALAYDVLSRAKRLRDEVREDLRLQRFGADDVQMEMYNELANGVAWLFPDDPVLGGGLVLMPDALLQSFGTLFPVQSMANYLPARRLESRLSRLIDRLEMVLGEPPTEPLSVRPAAEVLARPQTPEMSEIRRALDSLLRQRPDLPPVDVRDFNFIRDPELRRVLVADYVEAQRAFASEAFKAAAILAGGVIEGMLLDYLQAPSVTERPNYGGATDNFPRTDGAINWNRVSLTNLIGAASQLGALGAGVRALVEGARDFRDTVHPTAEVRLGARAGREEAELLLALVRLIYRDLSPVEPQGGPS
jgi:hypothetical protein